MDEVVEEKKACDEYWAIIRRILLRFVLQDSHSFCDSQVTKLNQQKKDESC